ncbi:PilZ domain-containing protein [Corallococcus exiguus]|nr:PilZ domain-containing protein [Corallococcus exiguus]NNB93498.1 PilZ domain-containing protein [Corallococcus exiguus]NNC05858.1 PilZ domain-containing protein [Corallococcus exiguus]NPC48175.1 PilZ domain-containing protein [Corallococcus exiguus]RKH78626.1 PilZ domain-containing protein [Corallococcus sp. AB032C]
MCRFVTGTLGWRNVTLQMTSHIDRRAFPRIHAPLYSRPARMKVGEKKQVLDVSLGGARIYSDEPQDVGSRLDLELFLPDGSSLECTARIVWAIKLPKDAVARFEVGLSFIDVPEPVLARLQTVLVADEG